MFNYARGFLEVKITAVSLQTKNPDRVNVSVDGKYRFSLDVYQVSELGIQKGKEYSEEQVVELENESSFGKLYARALEFTLTRPHSAKEVRDYLWRKAQQTKYKSRKTGEIKTKEGIPQSITDRVFARLEEKKYIDDKKFARFWVENRNQTKGSSRRKLTNELRVKGVSSGIIDDAFADSNRNDNDELKKIIVKKSSRYPDQNKLIQYLMRQGFSYQDILNSISED